MSSQAGPSSSPSSLDTTAEFFQVLAAPYHPPPVPVSVHRAQPRPDHAARCRAAINWTSPEPVEMTFPNPSVPASLQLALDQPIYRPHGRWAWIHGLSIDNPKQLLSLQKGAQCCASIDSGTVANEEIKYICRKWKTSKQKEWYGFYSELALYKSEQYLRPLQGDVVPHIIGVHIMPEAVSVTMELPHSSFWIESSPSMPEGLKERVIAAFEKIHARGVLHGDPELRHMLIGGDGKVMIIDFGMSRAIREHAALGIERAEPEEFRLEMRKVKYKLDYEGARKKEGDKVDDYLRRVRRNRKISELWKRRARGERVGPIPQYEEDPEEYGLDPPVNAQDFQEDWIVASDDSPVRVVVPGQSREQVAEEVQGLVRRIEEMYSGLASSTPRTGSPCAARIRHCHAQMSRSGDEEDGARPLLDRLRGCSRTGEEARARTRRPKRHPRRHGAEPSGPLRRCEDVVFPLSARQIEGMSRRRDYIRHRQVRNTYISSLSSNPGTAATFPSSIEVPEKAGGLKPEEYERIQESGRQAMLQYSRAPRGILKRRRDKDDVAPNEQMDPDTDQPAGKKVRFSPQLVPRARRPFFVDSASGRRVVCSRAPKRAMARNGRPELVDFTLPSLRTLSMLVGSLMAWVH